MTLLERYNKLSEKLRKKHETMNNSDQEPKQQQKQLICPIKNTS